MLFTIFILIGFNLKRVAEVWLDHYKEFFYRGDQQRYAKIDVGDLTKQFELKEKLKCKPFKYFLDVVAPEMLEWYPIVPHMFAALAVKNLGSNMCLGLNKSSYHIPIILDNCPADLSKPEHHSDFILTWDRSIKFNDTNDQCLDAAKLNLFNCHHQGLNQHWKFNLETRQIYNPYKQKCLSAKDKNFQVVFDTCNVNDQYQKWKWGYENKTALENWDNTGIKTKY
jgi:polypeptide N-acetylgalactosaminyltransferase